MALDALAVIADAFGNLMGLGVHPLAHVFF